MSKPCWLGFKSWLCGLLTVQSLANDFISLCFLHLFTSERRVIQPHILYRLYEDLMDPIMSTLNPRPLLLLFNLPYRFGVSRGTRWGMGREE